MSFSVSRGVAAGRVTAGLFLAAGGFMKLRGPAAEFAAALEAYRLFPDGWLLPLASVLPWVEYLAGLFLAAGLWIRWSSRLAVLLFGAFVLSLSVTMFRGISLTSCGCFGGEWLFSPGTTLGVDSLLLLASVAAAWDREGMWSVDRWARPRK